MWYSQRFAGGAHGLSILTGEMFLFSIQPRAFALGCCCSNTNVTEDSLEP